MRIKNDETTNYLLDEKKKQKNNGLMIEKYKKTSKYLNYVKHLFILASTITGCVSISAFASSVAVSVGITSPPVGINIFPITAGIKKYKSNIKKKKKKHNKIVLLGKDKFKTIEVLFSKSLIDSYISHDEFVSANNVLREYYNLKEKMKNPKTSVKYTKWKQWKFFVSVVKNILRTKIEMLKKKKNRLMLSSNRAICVKKNLRL